jgi:hypothetical protein
MPMQAAMKKPAPPPADPLSVESLAEVLDDLLGRPDNVADPDPLDAEYFFAEERKF